MGVGIAKVPFSKGVSPEHLIIFQISNIRRVIARDVSPEAIPIQI